MPIFDVRLQLRYTRECTVRVLAENPEQAQRLITAVNADHMLNPEGGSAEYTDEQLGLPVTEEGPMLYDGHALEIVDVTEVVAPSPPPMLATIAIEFRKPEGVVSRTGLNRVLFNSTIIDALSAAGYDVDHLYVSDLKENPNP